jgi:aspartate ammonia-lyase
MNKQVRVERDFIGELSIDVNCIYGINTARSLKNFPSSGLYYHPEFIKAYAEVKRACAVSNFQARVLDKEISDAISSISIEIEQGKHHEHIVSDPLSGGAGTSMNMNICEVIANLANKRFFNKDYGMYSPVHYLDSVNLNQSTNDTYPTAVRIAAMRLLVLLETNLTRLQAALQEKEKEYADIITVARTEMQDAVLITMGQLFSVWSEAIARDRWRIFKCNERIKVVNIGGQAVGTGLGAPKAYIFKVIENLRKITSLPLSRADNTVEATANQDAIVEASGILSALASNVLKFSGDLRLLSFPAIGELSLPPLQAGSTAMPEKVNPVVPEYASQTALSAIGSHSVIAMAQGMGNLSLSQFMPLISWHFLNEIHLLSNAASSLADIVPYYGK